MARVFEIRDCDGILWGVFPRRQLAQLRLEQILREHGPDFPRQYFVTTGALDDEDYYERFEKPIRKAPARKPARKKKVTRKTRAAKAIVDTLM